MSLRKHTLLPRSNGHLPAFFRPPVAGQTHRPPHYRAAAAAQHEKLSGIITFADAMKATTAMPGTEEKVTVLAHRYKCESDLFLADDAEGSE